MHHAAATPIASRIDGVRDVVPSYTVLTVEYDPRRTSIDTIATATRRALDTAADQDAAAVITAPTTYDGPDLAEVATRTGLLSDDVGRIHTSTEYRVHTLGFTPGFVAGPGESTLGA